ncbi:PepSY domain-containing protein [Rhodanobacter sp. B2A1Ga4]|uniref:PepSY domain-containing protein n=1 Tax=Rhodanobacter TaxID=75309 RepID=UPI000D379F5E|nr:MULTISPECIES: PepSY domain-containing protein [Rhodanobacter]MBQ4854769.1 PepSY domain-containing protein [Rhodanobacter sp. B2A1Ga4]
MSKQYLPLVLTLLLIAGGGVRAAQPAVPSLTLEQAVAKVQRETGGKVLSADPRKFGHHTEYRIKVLDPDGHVRVVAIPAELPRGGQSPVEPPRGNPSPVNSNPRPAIIDLGNRGRH